MEEEETSQSETPAETQATETETLDDIAGGFNVEEQTSQFQAQPAQSAPSYQPPVNDDGIPDPISNPDGYEVYMGQQAQGIGKLEALVGEMNTKIQGYEQQMTQQKVDADVEKAVSVINDKLGVEPEMAEVAMEIEYRNNPAFKKIWDNRQQNPAAFNKALGVIGDKWAGKFVNQADPQLAENVRAAKTSQQTMATAPKDDPYESAGKMSPSEFDAWWSQQKSD